MRLDLGGGERREDPSRHDGGKVTLTEAQVSRSPKGMKDGEEAAWKFERYGWIKWRRNAAVRNVRKGSETGGVSFEISRLAGPNGPMRKFRSEGKAETGRVFSTRQRE